MVRSRRLETRRLSRWGIVIRNGKTVGVAVGTNDWVGTQGPLWGRVMGPSVGESQRFCEQSSCHRKRKGPSSRAEMWMSFEGVVVAMRAVGDGQDFGDFKGGWNRASSRCGERAGRGPLRGRSSWRDEPTEPLSWERPRSFVPCSGMETGMD